MSADKPRSASLAPNVIGRLLSADEAQAEVARLHTPTMRARIEELRRRQEAAGAKAPKDLLAWEGFVDGAEGADVAASSDNGLLRAELAANPFRHVPKDEIERVLAEAEAALSSLTPGSEEACAVILAAVEAGAPLDAFPLPPPPPSVTQPNEPAAPRAGVEPSRPQQTRRRPVWPLALVGLALLGAGLVIWLLLSSPSPSPNLPPPPPPPPPPSPSPSPNLPPPPSPSPSPSPNLHPPPSPSPLTSPAPSPGSGSGSIKSPPPPSSPFPFYE